MVLDTPSDYSAAQSYRVQMMSGYNGTTSYVNQDYQNSNSSSRGRSISTVTLFEVAA